MADLDPATLEKFQRFQAMLAASPEIVEALNSPEILALAAKAAEEKKNAEPVLEPELESEPEPEYPVVGYGVSDDVSVMSEMTTPTVMTRQTVEEDEFYPEIDVTGKSTSGVHRGPRRIGLKIGVSASNDGDLPPPPPKSKPKSRHHRSTTRKIKPIAPMSKIVETDGSVTAEGESAELKSSTEFDASGKTPVKSKKSTWKPITVSPILKEKKEPPPFLVSSGPETARRTPRPSSYTNRNSRKGTNKASRGINRNRSMPVNIKISSSSSASSDSLHEEDDIIKAPSESISSPSASKKNPKRKSLSPTRPSDNVDLGTGTEKPLPRSATIERGVTRNRSLPSTSKKSSCSMSSNSSVDDDTTKISSESASSPSNTEGRSLLPTKNDADEASLNIFEGKKKRGKSVPKMRLVPVLAMKNKSGVSNNSSPAKLTQLDQTMSRPRGRSLSKRRTPSKEGTDKPHSPEQKTILSNNDKTSDPISDGEGTNSVSSIELSDSDSSSSPSFDNSSSRISVTRRWKPPSSDDSAIPPAFRSSSQRFKYSGSNHSGKSFKSSSSRVSSNGSKSMEPKESRSADSNHSGQSINFSSSRVSANESKLEKPKKSWSEEPKDASFSSDEDDYVRQTVRKPAKTASRQNPQQFTQCMTEITQVIQGDTSRPDDYLPGSGSPFSYTRKKKLQSVKKRFNNTSELGVPRSEDWIGSGKVRKRSWKVKKPVEC